LGGIAIGLGPGSFTGLRIGLATAKALAYAARLPLTGASSLATVALEGPEQVTLLTIAVARQQELYVGAYRRSGHTVEALSPEDAMTPAELAERVKSQPDAVVLGPAVPDYRAQLEGLGIPKDRILESGVVPSAGNLARLVQMPAAFDAQTLFALEPHYVRASAAELNPKFPAPAGPAPTARIRED
ncbi:MAG: tRNA (adenosine(37)-N6)-threonylcarbamoyltransferase complex dimerization subunit type 1 TsaB, partial [Myxococcaceae bacterium]